MSKIGNPLKIVRIERGEWDLWVADDRKAEYEWMQDGPYFNRQNTRLDSVFYVREIPYYWHRLESKPLSLDTSTKSDGSAVEFGDADENLSQDYSSDGTRVRTKKTDFHRASRGNSRRL